MPPAPMVANAVAAAAESCRVCAGRADVGGDAVAILAWRQVANGGADGDHVGVVGRLRDRGRTGSEVPGRDRDEDPRTPHLLHRVVERVEGVGLLGVGAE